MILDTKYQTLLLVLVLFALPESPSCADDDVPKRKPPAAEGLLTTEFVPGKGVWIDPKLAESEFQDVRITVWFDEQFLGDGKAYTRRSKELTNWKMRELRVAVIETLKSLADRSYSRGKRDLDQLLEDESIFDLERHWIINGFSCSATPEGIEALKDTPGVCKIFKVRQRRNGLGRDLANWWKGSSAGPHFPAIDAEGFSPARYKHPWFTRYLLADRVWREFHVTGHGTLNVVHDFNFLFSKHTRRNLYRSPNEIPANGKDDDGNGIVDDYHGYNFSLGSPNLKVNNSKTAMHGDACASIICGTGLESNEFEMGIAPESKWAGVISGTRIEASVEWAIEHGANTYSMSFSKHNLGEYRSHWRKVAEHGSFCGVFFVSGAGNYAMEIPVPIQMPIPQDIPNAVFAATGIKRDFGRAPFSSKGPVKWETEHYQDGEIQKPEVCAFNFNVPAIDSDGNLIESLKGNSFAGPMLCGTLSLMVSADADLLPWDAREILTSTATDVAADGIDYETGHGLVNSYRAVKEVLRRKAIREGNDAARFTGRDDNDEIDAADIAKQQQQVITHVEPGSQASRLGVKLDDILIRYNKRRIYRMEDFSEAFAEALAEKRKRIPVRINRGGTLIDLQFSPGKLGISSRREFLDPTFE